MARPTEQQLAVIEHDEGRSVVFAVAGSGKTTTMGWRVQRLTQAKGVRPERIVATTFSRFARDQMRAKFDQLGISSDVYTLTLHQFASRVITLANKKIDFMPRVQIGDRAQQARALRDVKTRLIDSGIVQDKELCASIKDVSEDDFFDLLGKMKGALEFTEKGFERLPEQLQNISSRRAFATGSRWQEILIDAYEDERLKRRFRGFDDMLIDALEAVYCSQTMRADISTRFDHIIVDEYQDINKAQDALVRVCDEKRGNLMVIGDDDQTIYEWRGATPEFIRNKIDSQGWKKYFLDLNFRSCAPQVILASQCIAKNRLRAEKKMQPTGDFGGDFELVKCQSNEDQAQKLVSIIKEKLEAGTPLGDQAILIRRYDQSLPIEKELIQNKIQYTIPGTSFFFDRREVQFVLSFLLLYQLEGRLLKEERSPTPPERREYWSLLKQVAHRARTYIKADPDLMSICQSALDPGSSLADAICEYAAEREDQNLANALALGRFYEDCDRDSFPSINDLISKLEKTIDIREKIVSAAPDREVGTQRAGVLESLKSFGGSRTLDELLDEVTDLRSYWRNGLQNVNPSQVLKIYTVFKAKGLEFPVVYLPDTHRQVDSASVTGANIQGIVAAGPEEERRIFYVAVTRSMRDLYMFYWQQPSQYLEEAGFERIADYRDLSLKVLSDEDRGDLDARQIGRVFSAYSYKYETKNTFASIFAGKDHTSHAAISSCIKESIEYLKGDNNISLSDKIRYEKLQVFWDDIDKLADRVRGIDGDEQDRCGGVQAHKRPTNNSPSDPFDEIFADA